MKSKVLVLCGTNADDLQEMIDQRLSELGDGWEVTQATTYTEIYPIPGAPVEHGFGPHALMTTTIVVKMAA